MNDDFKLTEEKRTSVLRRMLAYILMFFISSIPLGAYYILSHYGLLQFEAKIVEFQLGQLMIEITFVEYMIPMVLSTMIGVSGSFLIWCYYTRTRCMRKQVPNVLQSYNSE